jgi:hypothetical protein
VDLEVEVRRRRDRVTGIADEADDIAGLHLRPLPRERREGGEVGVVELVPGAVAEPEPVAADVVPPDAEERPVGDGQERRATGRRCRCRGAGSWSAARRSCPRKAGP